MTEEVFLPTLTPERVLVGELGQADDFSPLSVSTAVVKNPQRHGPLLNADQGISQLKDYDRDLGLSGKTLEARWKHMAADPKSFFQANPGRFRADVTSAFAPMLKLFPRESPEMPVNNDAHLGNYAWFYDNKTSGLLWGLVDFDTAARGKPEWDVGRNAAHVAIIARQLGAPRSKQNALAGSFARSYFDEIRRLAQVEGPLPTGLKQGEVRGAVRDALEKVIQPRRRELLAEWVDGPKSDTPRFKDNAETERVSKATRDAVLQALPGYADALPDGVAVARPLHVYDVVRKVDSGGSTFGLNRYWVLVKGADGKSPRILEVKQELPDVGVGAKPDLRTVDAGSIVANGYRALMGMPNPLTGHLSLPDGGYLVREVEPQKQRVDPTGLGSFSKLERLANQDAVALARAHAQEGRAAGLAQWIGPDTAEGVETMGTFAVRYADQNDAYASALKDALK